jgi:hypothetical protein
MAQTGRRFRHRLRRWADTGHPAQKQLGVRQHIFNLFPPTLFLQVQLQKMVKTLVKTNELEDLFNQSEPPEDREKLKEALWQVHQVVWSPELKNHLDESRKTYIEASEIMNRLETKEDRDRMKKALTGVTQTTEGIPVSDVRRALSPVRNIA